MERFDTARVDEALAAADGPRCRDESFGPSHFDVLAAEVRALREERNTPQIVVFVEAVQLEALHQRERWSAEHDAGKAPQDWFWLLGYLSGKALASAVAGNTEKALHHTISSAAVLLNWHAAISGSDTRMRPGIAEPVADGRTLVKSKTEWPVTTGNNEGTR